MTTNLPVLCAPATQHGCRSGGRGAALAADPVFAAQMLGAGSVRRGLRGGPPVLQAARRAYLEAEWSGVADRRLAAGCVTLKQV